MNEPLLGKAVRDGGISDEMKMSLTSLVYFYNYFDAGKDSEDETTTMVTGAGIVAPGAGDQPRVGAATVRLGEKTGRGAQKRIDPLNDRSGIYCSNFSQTHNVGNIANFVFQDICSSFIIFII